MGRKLNTEQFIQTAKEIHGDKFDYSKTIYISYQKPITIICSEHGEFCELPNNHITHSTKYTYYGCRLCYLKYKGLKYRLTTEEFIKRATLVHDNKYDYSKTIYEKASSKVIIICPKHGEFKQAATDHINAKNGCEKCSYEIRNIPSTIEEFINKANIIHNFKYDYTKTIYYNAATKVDIICTKHGIFKQTPNHHLSDEGCPICKLSKGEKLIREYLINKNITFKEQKTFKDCINPFSGRKLKFDFYLLEHNICIEFDGRQHYEPCNFTSSAQTQETKMKNLSEIQYRDNIKNLYCKQYNIQLIRIKYTDKENIYNILESFIKQKDQQFLIDLFYSSYVL